MFYAHHIRYYALLLLIACSLGACVKWSAVHDKTHAVVVAESSDKKKRFGYACEMAGSLLSIIHGSATIHCSMARHPLAHASQLQTLPA
jgi:hypothetical protein